MRHLAYDAYLDLIHAAVRQSLVVQSVEAWRTQGDESLGSFHNEGTYSFPHNAYPAEWAEAVLRAGAAALSMLADTPERSELSYSVWLDAAT